MGSARYFASPNRPAIAGPRQTGVSPMHVTINVGGELEDGRAFFGTDAVWEFVSP